MSALKPSDELLSAEVNELVTFFTRLSPHLSENQVAFYLPGDSGFEVIENSVDLYATLNLAVFEKQLTSFNDSDLELSILIIRGRLIRAECGKPNELPDFIRFVIELIHQEGDLVLTASDLLSKVRLLGFQNAPILKPGQASRMLGRYSQALRRKGIRFEPIAAIGIAEVIESSIDRRS